MTTSARHAQALIDMLTSLVFDCQVDSGEISCSLSLSEMLISGNAKVRSSNGSIEFEVKLAYGLDKSIIHGQVRVVNISSNEIDLRNISQTFSLSEKPAAVQAFTSTWCRESQPVNLDIETDSAIIESRGRSCQGYAPYLRVDLSASSVILNLLPCGDWRVFVHKDGSRLILDRPGDWMVRLQPGEAYNIGLDWLIQICHKDNIYLAGGVVQQYVMERLDLRGANEVMPVVYNSWFDRFHKISSESLETQLDAAAEIGCEVFVIDAGWYGDSQLSDWTAVGDWRERSSVFSEKTLSDFADLVRSKKLGFGIWMEPERVNLNAPVYSEHPDWFIKADAEGFCYPDLMKHAAQRWVFSEISRVVETYGVKWLKLDCNFDFSTDTYSLGHQSRMQAWYDILNEISHVYPGLILEGCASGGLRNDLLTVSHFHTNFLSDTVDPIDVIRIGMSSFSRMAPRKTSKWAVLYPTGNGWTPYGNDCFDTGDLVLCPVTATADNVSSYHLDFAVRVAMTGVLGISGNIVGLDKNLRSCLAEHLAFYKNHREFIQNSIAIPLTPIRPLENRSGISVIQLSSPIFNRSMLFTYNIDSTSNKVVVRPYFNNVSSTYSIKNIEGLEIANCQSSKILQDGLEIECLQGHTQIVFIEEV